MPIRPLKLLVEDFFSRQDGPVLAGAFEITAEELYGCLSDEYLRLNSPKPRPAFQFPSRYAPHGLASVSSSDTSESHPDAAADPPSGDPPHPNDSASNHSSDVNMSGTETDMSGDSEVLAEGLAMEAVAHEQGTSGIATEQRSSYGRVIRKKQRG